MITDLSSVVRHRMLPALSWPGGIPLYYIDATGRIVCSDCANERESEPIIGADYNWDNSELYCNNCEVQIEKYWEVEDDNVS